ncbi:MAG: T9SS type A sorting domain-containing protein, partial [candidate division KSB1 bacterium]|nr:T9SS type A sorting domain-containing protein [candidate division KSB1 bacterium]
GDDRETTITPAEQALIANFLDSGGRLLLTGQNIGFDLVGDGSTSDSSFFHNYLHAQYLADSAKSQMMVGVNGDPITDKMFVYLQPTAGAGNQTAPDVLAPLFPAETILKYVPSQKSAAIKFSNETNGSRLIYFAFGFEGISGPKTDIAANLLKKAIEWLVAGQTAISQDNNSPALSKAFALYQNYPNPFNPNTNISFDLPGPAFVKLIIYDINGRFVQQLVCRQMPVGHHTIIWNGRDQNGTEVSSGIYLCRLQAGSFAASRKLALIR